MTSVTGMVAAGAFLPVEVLIGLELACFENDFQVCGTRRRFLLRQFRRLAVS